jgi:hypothetical protein
MLAHYLDATYLFYVEALLLNLLLVKSTSTAAVPGGALDR